MKEFDKLVRDKIPHIIRGQGRIPITEIVDDAKFAVYLRNKLKEEVDEYLSDNNIMELADILEVVYTIAELNGVSKDDIEKVRAKKLFSNGGFSNKVVLKKILEKGEHDI